MEESIDDLNRKFQNTYIKLNGRLVFVREIVEGDDEVTLFRVQDAKNGDEEVIGSEKNIEAIMPDRKFFNYKGKKKTPLAVLFYRVPRRQWKRSLCLENTRFIDPFREISDHCNLSGRTNVERGIIEWGQIECLLNSEYPRILDALPELKVVRSVALSPEFMVCLSHIHPDKFLLRSLYNFIGEIDKQIYLYHPPMEQEVRDFLYRTGQNLRINLNARIT